MHENSICVGNFCVQTKIIKRTKWAYPHPLFHSSHSFLNCWKTTKYMNMDFSGFQFVFINVLWKSKNKCMNGLFCISNFLEVGRKKLFLRHWSTGLVCVCVSKGASLALVDDASSDGFTIKIPYGVDVLLHRPASQPIFSYSYWIWFYC